MLRVQHDSQKPSKAARDRCWKAFKAMGHSNHSARGLMLTYIIERCEQERIQYQLTAVPGVGYFIREHISVPALAGQQLCPRV